MLFYNFIIRTYLLAIKIAALFENKKAQLWIDGRRDWRENLKESLKDNGKWIWFHCSSLGEFEQGRPLIEKLRVQKTECRIVLTFFSPSGYEIRKNYPHADVIMYLPIDTKKNAEDFINLIQPKEVFFIKYDFWFHYLNELNKKEIPVYFISSSFRKEQRFFKWYGRFFKRMLRYVTHFFVQDSESKELLHSIGYNNCTITGDTRFDRVVEAASQPKEREEVKRFKGNNILLVAGSTWSEDERLLIDLINEVGEGEGMRLLIVPHEISHHHISALEYLLIEKAGLKPDDIALYSQSEDDLTKAKVFIVDTVGLLTSIYHYADIAYIGGGFGKGIHNTLEAAVYGVPVIFGPKYHKFKEAADLINQKAAFSVNSSKELFALVNQFIQNKEHREMAGRTAKNYVYGNAGATNKIIQTLNKNQISN